MGSKKKPTDSSNSESSSSDSDPEAETVYYVEVIKGARVKEGNDFEYRVKWYEYGSEDETWEPTEHVEDCDRLLKSFWKEVGKENKKNPGPVNTQYTPSPEWIRREQERFHREMKDIKEKEKKKSAERKEAKRREHFNKLHALQEEKRAKEKKRMEERAEKTSESLNDALGLFIDMEDELMSDTSKKRQKSKTTKVESKKAVPKKPLPMTSTAGTFTSGRITPVEKGPSPALKVSIPGRQSKYSGLKISKLPTATSPAEPGPSRLPETSKVSRPTPLTHIGISSRESSIGPSPLSAFLPPLVQQLSTKSPVETFPATGEDVDNFLATLSIGDSEIQRSRTQNQNFIPPRAIHRLEPLLSADKNWIWSGELFLDITGNEMAQRLCEISISDVLNVNETGLKLNFFLEKMDSLRFSKAYNRSEANNILPGLKRIDQIAKISARQQKDNLEFLPFVKYLQLRNLVISCAFMNSHGHAAEMIIFPSTDKSLFERLKVPLRYESSDALVLALLPWHIPPSKYNNWFFREDDIKGSDFDADMAKIEKGFPLIVQRPSTQTSLRILEIEHWFIEFLPQRGYCIWSYNVERTDQGASQRLEGMNRKETKALVNVLSRLKAINLGYHTMDTRVVFVHVGSLRYISKLPLLAERRATRPDIRFVTYGTHECIKPSKWGFREIFPTGGIVTFTADAILDDPLSVSELIERIHRHPLWACYIHPHILSVFIRATCPGENPVSLYKRMPLLWGRILDLIDEGKVSLLESPGFAEQASPGMQLEPPVRWIDDQFSSALKTPIDHVEDGYNLYVRMFSDKSEIEIRDLVQSIISSDLAKMQAQQAICENYRRFVVIKGTKEADIPWNKDNFEWRTIEEFSFMDDYFKSSEESSLFMDL